MKMRDKIKKRLQNWLEVNNSNELELSINADSRKKKIEELFVWYVGDSDMLQSYYATMRKGFTKKNYFWSVSAYEDNKKTHSGLPSIICDTLSSIQGVPLITCNDERLEEILNFNNFEIMIKEQETPLTLALGGGCFIVNLKNNPYVDIEFLDERFIDYEYEGNILKSVIITRYYEYNDKKYVLKEKRTNYSISYKLFTDDGKEVTLTTIPQTENLEDLEHNFNHCLAVPVRFKRNKLEKNYGRSVFAEKLDLLDDLDQIYSVMSEAVRVSTPVEFISTELRNTSANGMRGDVSTFKRKFIRINKSSQTSPDITTSQPMINFEGYRTALFETFSAIVLGIISPSTLGIDLARNSNATAQREKEKVTFFTRDDIIENQVEIIKDICNKALQVQDYLDGKQETQEYEISVEFKEFTNNSFDELITRLYPVLASKGISPEEYVKQVWQGSLSEDKEKELIDYLTKENQSFSEVEELPYEG